MLTRLLLIILSIISISFQENITLNIEINNLKNSKGKVLLELQDENKNTIKGISQEIVNNRCIISIEGLSPAKYVFKYFHDENDNKEIDINWIGIPKEGFGFSNNAKVNFGPSQHKMIFELNKDTTMVCNPQYLKK
ncbi:MAG: DUF2141 domain-containing protein [Bacteroidetes bacterium]|nr:DUF2141 domain-containing protein [Bacteroidota bacterium]